MIPSDIILACRGGEPDGRHWLEKSLSLMRFLGRSARVRDSSHCGPQRMMFSAATVERADVVVEMGHHRPCP